MDNIEEDQDFSKAFNTGNNPLVETVDQVDVGDTPLVEETVDQVDVGDTPKGFESYQDNLEQCFLNCIAKRNTYQKSLNKLTFSGSTKGLRKQCIINALSLVLNRAKMEGLENYTVTNSTIDTTSQSYNKFIDTTGQFIDKTGKKFTSLFTRRKGGKKYRKARKSRKARK